MNRKTCKQLKIEWNKKGIDYSTEILTNTKNMREKQLIESL